MNPSQRPPPGLTIYPVKARASGADTEKEVALKASVNAVNDTKSGPGAGDTSYFLQCGLREGIPILV